MRSSRILTLLWVGVFVGFSGVRDAAAAPVPTVPEVVFEIDDQSFDVSSLGVETSLGYRWGMPNEPVVIRTAAGDELSIYAYFDQDPAVTYSVGVTDAGSPSIFNFSFGGAIVPVSAPNVVFGSFGGTLTDLGQDGVAISTVGNPIQRSFLSGPSNPITSMGVDVGGSFSAPCAGPYPNLTCNPGVVTYPTQSIGFIPGPPQTGAWDNLQVLTTFSLSGGGDTAAVSGVARIEAAPEPSLLLLLGAGLGLLAWRRR
jgi:hypothetical protein